MDDQREAFEAWISAPPFEAPVDQWPDDPINYAWPGLYKGLDVEMAWNAWQAAMEHAKKTMCNRN